MLANNIDSAKLTCLAHRAWDQLLIKYTARRQESANGDYTRDKVGEGRRIHLFCGFYLSKTDNFRGNISIAEKGGPYNFSHHFEISAKIRPRNSIF